LSPYFFFTATFCVSADAATVLTAFGVLGLAKSLPAVEATRADVVSLEVFFVAMIGSLNCVNQKMPGIDHQPPAKSLRTT
jgi:hypothetical protein